MIPLVDREGARTFDRKWIERGVSSLLLMENAGRGAAEAVGDVSGKQVVVVCGTGNNGGDGFVVARRLRVLGAEVRVILVGDEARFTDDAKTQAAALRGLGVWIEPWTGGLGTADLVVDALFGTGLSRALEGDAAAVVAKINEVPSSTAVLALDVPSGLDANTGAVLGSCVRATLTATFGFAKTGLYTPRGAEHAGEIVVVDIGVPSIDPDPVAWLFTADDARSAIRRRQVGAHKNANGHVLVVGGSPGKAGAPQLAAYAAARAGAGLVTVATWAPGELTQLPPSIMHRDLAELGGLFDGMRALVVGPGLGTGPEAAQVFERVIASELPAVLDADAFTWAAKDAGRLRRDAPTVLTPHPAELARILGRDTKTIEANRHAAAQEAVEATGAVVVLKGAHTIVAAPGVAPLVSPFAVPALGVAGSGDTLAGIVGALLGGGHVAEEAAWLGVWLHGEAGRIVAGKTDRGIFPTEFADALPALFES